MKKPASALLLILLIFLAVSLLVFPQEGFAAAQAGLKLWWESILPALLPFFIVSELLVLLGAMRLLGRWLEPLMRPLFNLPGAAALAVIMGYTSGFPTGAAITAGLRKEGAVTRDEGERLLAFTNNAGPFFILAGVGVGMLNCPQAGVYLAAIHYGLNLLLGVILGLFSKKRGGRKALPLTALPNHNHEPVGALLKKAALKALTNIGLIGGFILFFSVLTKMLWLSGAGLLFCRGLEWLLTSLSLSPALAAAFFNGFWEMSIGAAAAGQSAAPFAQNFAACAAILAWGGLSVQGQVSAMVSDTDLRLRYYLPGRLVHAAASFLLALPLAGKMALASGGEKPVAPMLPPVMVMLAFSLLLLFSAAVLGKALGALRKQ
ncbi:MAG: sporulation integral membrane protein YlbJ [Clostridiales bacterium]|nr:sporulation integral membrane protein YlbJ [Clostridiales bacterium]